MPESGWSEDRVTTLKSLWLDGLSASQVAKALGGDQIETLMAHTGLSRQDLLAGLSQQLPEIVNQLTPDGRLPTEQDLSRSL